MESPQPPGNSAESTGADASKDKRLDGHRWKMAVACDVCRKRKVRCDGGTDGNGPCLRCAKKGADCTFTLPARKRRKIDGPQDAGARPPPCMISNAPSPVAPPTSSSTPTEAPAQERSKEHLLLIDTDDQVVWSGPSSGMPLLAKLGLLNMVEVHESNVAETPSRGNPSTALGIASAVTATGDYWDFCLEKCDLVLMNSLIRQHLENAGAVFFPLLHPPSFLSEYIAVTERRLICTPQYGALIMSILAVTARLVEGAQGLLPSGKMQEASEKFYDFARDLLHVSKNKLDIRYILALYHLAVYAEGRNSIGAIHAGYIAEAVGLCFATGLHRDTEEWEMDPVTHQIRTRLFWALFSLDTSLAYSQGRPTLIRLSECTVALPVIADNTRITKEGILPEPVGADPPLALAACVPIIEISTVLEDVLSAINTPDLPSRTHLPQHYFAQTTLDRSTRLLRASSRLNQIEAKLPAYLQKTPSTEAFSNQDRVPRNFVLFQSVRIHTSAQFVRTLIARQRFVEEIEESPPQAVSQNVAGKEACALSLSIIKSYARLRFLGMVQFCNFHAVSHLAAAAHTLLACMMRDRGLAFEYRGELLTAIDVLLVFKSRYPSAETAGSLLVHLSRRLDVTSGASSTPDDSSVRILARKQATRVTSQSVSPPTSTTCSAERPDFDWLVRAAEGVQAVGPHPLLGARAPPTEQTDAPLPHYTTSSNQAPQFSSVSDASLLQHEVSAPMGSSSSSVSANLWGLAHQAPQNELAGGAFNFEATWDDLNLSFLNDGLFNVV